MAKEYNCECDLPLTLGNWLLAIVHLSWLEFELYFHVRCVVASVRWANSRSSSAEIYLSQFDVLYVWCVCVCDIWEAWMKTKERRIALNWQTTRKAQKLTNLFNKTQNSTIKTYLLISKERKRIWHHPSSATMYFVYYFSVLWVNLKQMSG